MFKLRQQASLAAIISSAVLMSLSGCAVGPDYQRPVVVLPAHYTTAVATSAADVRQDWWAYFNDKTLSQLIEKALTNNVDLAVASARIREATGLSQETGAAFIPQIDADVGTTNQHTSGMNQTALNISPTGTGGTTFVNRRATLSTSYELDVWGKLRRNDENAKAQAQASFYARDSVRLSLAAMVSNAYLALRSLDAQLAAVGNSVDSRQETLRLAKIRIEAGLSSPLEQ